MVSSGATFLVLMLGLAFAVPARRDTSDAIALRPASERGHQIFVLDEADWVSPDEMLRKMPDPRASGFNVKELSRLVG